MFLRFLWFFSYRQFLNNYLLTLCFSMAEIGFYFYILEFKPQKPQYVAAPVAAYQSRPTGNFQRITREATQ